MLALHHNPAKIVTDITAKDDVLFLEKPGFAGGDVD